MPTSALEQYIAQRLTEGWNDGYEIGLEQGREQGEVQGKRALLNVLVKARFGDIPPTLAQRIAGADSVDPDTLSVRVTAVERLEDL